jgi:hypothetical protein
MTAYNEYSHINLQCQMGTLGTILQFGFSNHVNDTCSLIVNSKNPTIHFTKECR